MVVARRVADHSRPGVGAVQIAQVGVFGVVYGEASWDQLALALVIRPQTGVTSIWRAAEDGRFVGAFGEIEMVVDFLHEWQGKLILHARW